MRRFGISALSLCILLMSMLVSCAPAGDIVTKEEYTFSEAKSQSITSVYRKVNDEAFYTTLDFQLTSGRVDWEIKNPKGEKLFEGYAIYENGKTFRQLIYPAGFLSGHMSNKEVVLDSADFSFLQFESPVQKGAYQLILTPNKAEGKSVIEWHSKLPRK